MEYVIQKLVFLLRVLMVEHVSPLWTVEARKCSTVHVPHSLLVCTVKQQLQAQMVIVQIYIT